MADRLALATLDACRPGVRRPGVDPRELQIGIVHLGLGAFHRAHQAVFTEDAIALSGDTRWGILGVTQRSPRVADLLRPQDCLYSVLSTGDADVSPRVVGSLREAAHLGADTPRVLDAIAAPTTRVVSLTVTEKGYRRGPDGRLDLTDADVAVDVVALAAELAGTPAAAPARTPVGALTRGLARRHATHGEPVTVVCCDNLPDNGAVLARLVRDMAEAVGPGAGRFLDHLAEHVRFPSSMVDRITPATTDRHRAQATDLLGLVDEAVVVAEPFSQWVLSDDAAGPLPPWERAGVTVTDDVGAWETVKLRILNGSHSALAYLGLLAGHRRIDQAVTDPAIRAVVDQLMAETALTLAVPDGLDLDAYRSTTLERFANPGTGHTTAQVSADGSQKLPIRLLGTIADRIAAGSVPSAATRAVAAWIVVVARGRDVTGAVVPVDDPLGDRLHRLAAGPDAGLVDRMLTLGEVFGPELAGHDGFRTALRAEVADLLGQLG